MEAYRRATYQFIELNGLEEWLRVYHPSFSDGKDDEVDTHITKVLIKPYMCKAEQKYQSFLAWSAKRHVYGPPLQKIKVPTAATMIAAPASAPHAGTLAARIRARGEGEGEGEGEEIGRAHV